MRVAALVVLLAVGCASPPPTPMWQDARVVGVVPERQFDSASEARAFLQSALDGRAMYPDTWSRVTDAAIELWHVGSDADREWMLAIHRGEPEHVHIGRNVLNAALRAETQRVVSEQRLWIEPVAWDLEGEVPEGADPELERAKRLWAAIQQHAPASPEETVAYSEGLKEFDAAREAVLRGESVDPLRFVWGKRCGTFSSKLTEPRSHMGFLISARAGDLETATWWATRTGIHPHQGAWSPAWLDAVGAGWERAAAGAWLSASGGYGSLLFEQGGSEAAGWLRRIAASGKTRIGPAGLLRLLEPGKQPITEAEADLLLAEAADLVRLEVDSGTAYAALRELNHYGEGASILEAARRVRSSPDEDLRALAMRIVERRERWLDLETADPLKVAIVDPSGRSTAGRDVSARVLGFRSQEILELVTDEQGVVTVPGDVVRNSEVDEVRLRIDGCAGRFWIEGDDLLADRKTWTLGAGQVRIEGVEGATLLYLAREDDGRVQLRLDEPTEVCGLDAGTWWVERPGGIPGTERTRSEPFTVPADPMPVVQLPAAPVERLPAKPPVRVVRQQPESRAPGG